MFRFKLLLTLCLLSLIQTTMAQNLIINNEFQSDLNSWNLTGTQLPLWDSFDLNNDPSSGSAFISNIETTSSSDVEVLRQCFNHESRHYQLGTRVFIPESQAVNGSVILRYNIRLNSNDCTGGAQAIGGYLYNQTGQWGLLQAIDVNFQSLGGTIEFIIAVRKTEDFGEFVAYIDEPYLLSENIFSNSFE